MVQISIPPKLSEKLDKTTMKHPTLTAVNAFTTFLSNQSTAMYFFPEYTDHSKEHVASVLAAAEALIHTDAWSHVTPEDAVILVLAALLHDSAMYLTPDSFLALVDSKSEWNQQFKPIKHLDNRTWPEIFDEFFADARRWDGRTLHHILGDVGKSPDDEEDFVHVLQHPREYSNPENWTVRHRKFYGEFIRRHHARLAHEFAIYGVPAARSGASSSTAAHAGLTLPNELPSAIKDLAGLVARSHGVALRHTFDYLKKKYGSRVTCHNAHPVYVMALLRIADYIQMKADRVSSTQLQIQRLRSPISVDEWNKHFATEDIRIDEDDLEAIYVLAHPQTARTFLQLRKLLVGLQAELDTTWATLGEVFSRRAELAKLQLSLRRVRSNLDDPNQFMESDDPGYYPIEVKFDSAGSDLLKRLVAPLYGNRPEIGVRELLQNSVDAVHELRRWDQDHGIGNDSVEMGEQQPDVLISIDLDEKGHHWFSISDKGIGMTARTVRDYFLRVGASYRDSSEWRRQNLTPQGYDRISRSGRFGVGVLAAFLLGDELEVTTRHVSQPTGIRFNAIIDAEVLELRRIETVVGTTIRVLLSQSAVQTLLGKDRDVNTKSPKYQHWDWWCLQDPVVERRVLGKTIPQQNAFPPDSPHVPPPWWSIEGDGFLVHWCLGQTVIAVNGIRLARFSDREFSPSTFQMEFHQVHISVFDRKQRLPLTLDRSQLLEGRPVFAAELEHQIALDFCAFALVHAPTEPPSPDSYAQYMMAYPAFSYDLDVLPWAATSDGCICATEWHLWQSRRDVVTLLRQGADRRALPTDMGPHDVLLLEPHGESYLRWSNEISMRRGDSGHEWLRGPLGSTGIRLHSSGTQRCLVNRRHWFAYVQEQARDIEDYITGVRWVAEKDLVVPATINAT